MGLYLGETRYKLFINGNKYCINIYDGDTSNSIIGRAVLGLMRLGG